MIHKSSNRVAGNINSDRHKGCPQGAKIQYQSDAGIP